MTYLVDTSIVSALAPTRRNARADLANWFRRAEALLYFSVVTLSELNAGVAKLRRTGVEAKAEALATWIELLLQTNGRRFLPIDTRVAALAGERLDRTRAFRPGYEDIAIAATAEAHGLVVLTANEAHFEQIGVSWINPLKSLPVLPDSTP